MLIAQKSWSETSHVPLQIPCAVSVRRNRRPASNARLFHYRISVLSAMNFIVQERRLVLLLFSILLVLALFPYVQGSLLHGRTVNVCQAVIVVYCMLVVSTRPEAFRGRVLRLVSVTFLQGGCPGRRRVRLPFVMASIGAVRVYAFAISDDLRLCP